MSVLQFRQPAQCPRGWHADEVHRLKGACTPSIATGEAAGFEIGATETGDPQLYLLGPAPEHACILSVSRLGRLYVLEDGSGRVLFEHGSLDVLTQEIRGALRRTRSDIVARLAVAWCGIREFFEEKVEPILAEPVEILTHVAPQLAALV
jgi:hypothetical protein